MSVYSDFRSEILHILTERGFLYQHSDLEGLDAKITQDGLIAYVGYDCTSASLHIGHLISILMLYWIQKTGGKPIILMGGGTSLVGDPSGRDENRKLLTPEIVAQNLSALQKTFSAFLSFGDGASDAQVVNNAEWLMELGYIDFLRHIGRHFSVNRMLSMDSVSSRLENSRELSFIEFNYMCLQAYDFIELNRRYGCYCQLGGSDQWGNIVMGIDLGRRLGTEPLYGVTAPLLTNSSGKKMGKTAAGAVWLNGDLFSAYDYWQFWRNVEDQDVERFLKLFTLLPLSDIQRMSQSDINEAKKILAHEATALLHGSEAAAAASETARQVFEEGRTAETLPSLEVAEEELRLGLGVSLAFLKAGLVSSQGEARRNIRAGALKINDVAVTDECRSLNLQDLDENHRIKLSFGRKKHVLLKIQGG